MFYQKKIITSQMVLSCGAIRVCMCVLNLPDLHLLSVQHIKDVGRTADVQSDLCLLCCYLSSYTKLNNANILYLHLHVHEHKHVHECKHVHEHNSSFIHV